jgi:hypothetical protein
VEEFFGGRIPPQVVSVPADRAEGAYGVSTLPDSYFVTASGELRSRMLGTRQWDGAAAREALFGDREG